MAWVLIDVARALQQRHHEKGQRVEAHDDDAVNQTVCALVRVKGHKQLRGWYLRDEINVKPSQAGQSEGKTKAQDRQSAFLPQ